MRRSKVISISACVLFLLGAATMGLAIYPWSQTNSVNLPGEASVYINWDIPGYLNGHLSGYFSTDGSIINLLIMNNEQYAEYKQDLDPGESLFSSTGASGSFSVDLPDEPFSLNVLSAVKYHICVDHGGTEGADQTVILHMETRGLCVYFLGAGAAFIASGIGVILHGRRTRAKEDAALRRSLPQRRQ